MKTTTYYIINKDRSITTASSLAEARATAKGLVLTDESNRGFAIICTADEAGNLTVRSEYAGNCGISHHPRVVTVAGCEGESCGNLADYASR